MTEIRPCSNSSHPDDSSGRNQELSVETRAEKISDATLVERTLTGDKEAFACLYDRYAPLVRSVLFPVARNSHDSDDLTQEVFLRAFTKLKNLEKPAAFGGWVAGIARHVSKEKRRSQSRDRHDHFGEVPETDREDRMAADGVVAADEAQLILGELEQLDDREREAIHAFFLQGKNVDETARILDLGRSGTYALLQRACRKLAGRLAKLGITPN